MKDLKWFAKEMGACMLVEAEWEHESIAGIESRMRDYMEDAANNFIAKITYSEMMDLELDTFVRGRQIYKASGEFMDLDMALHNIVINWLYEVQPLIANCIAAYFNYDLTASGNCGHNHECYYQMNKLVERLY